MEYAYSLNGGSHPLVMKFQVNAAFPDAGIVARAPGAGNGGVALPTTTSAADAVGVTLDTATYVTAQQSGNADTERLVSVIVNPDAIFRALLSGGATEGTALAQHTVTTASTDGLAVTTATAWDSPTFDEGSVWGLTGANLGRLRKLTSVSTTAGTVTVSFPVDIAVGDIFLRAPYTPLQTVTLQFTTLFTQADASIAVGTGASLRVLELIGKGTTDSEVRFMLNDHAFRDAT